MATMSESLDARAQQESLQYQAATAEATSEQAVAARESAAILADQNKIHLDTEENTGEAAKSLAVLVSLVQNMVVKQEEQAKTLADMSAQQTAATMIKPADNKKEEIKEFKDIGSLLKHIVSLKVAEKVEEKGFGKLLGKAVKFMDKSNNKTKVIDAKDAKKAGDGDGKPKAPGLDNKMITAGMASAVMKALNPLALVEAFFTKLLPLLLVAGLLIYGFVVGFLGGDVYDALAVMIGVIVVAVLAYVAYCYVKEAIINAVKIACEFMKVAIEAAADWATVPIIIAMIAVIGVAFLAAAALIIVIIGAALVGIVLAMYLMTKAIKKLMTNMIEDIMDVFEEQFENLGKMITAVVDTFKELVPVMTSLMTSTAETLSKGISEAMDTVTRTFSMMSGVMKDLAKEISDIFNGLAAAIIASQLGQAVKKYKEEEVTQLTVSALTAEFAANEEMWQMMADQFGDSVNENFGKLNESLMATYTHIADTVTKNITTLFETAYKGIAAITTGFITLLLSMPVLGLLLGLTGGATFAALIAPLLHTANEIKDLLTKLVKENKTHETSIIRAASYSNAVGGNTQYNTYMPSSFIQPTDGTASFSAADEIVAAVESSGGGVSAEYLDKKFEDLHEDLINIVKAVVKGDDKKKGILPWF